jgi:YfiH family protein
VQAADGRPWPAAGLICEPLLEFAGHVFTTRRWALGQPARAVERRGWDEVSGAVGVDPDRLCRVRQVHGASVVVAVQGSDPQHDADIIISRGQDLALAVQAADCVPLLLVDRRTGAVSAAHAGWRGLAAGVPAVTVRAMCEHLGSQAADLLAAIGPAIGRCCYEVGPDVREVFVRSKVAGNQGRWFAGARVAGKWMFDTWASARSQLEAAGIPPEQIFEARLCTASHPDVFCSYRREGAKAGRMAAAIVPRTQRS